MMRRSRTSSAVFSRRSRSCLLTLPPSAATVVVSRVAPMRRDAGQELEGMPERCRIVLVAGYANVRGGMPS